jgi:hypothetical protein
MGGRKVEKVIRSVLNRKGVAHEQSREDLERSAAHIGGNAFRDLVGIRIIDVPLSGGSSAGRGVGMYG